MTNPVERPAPPSDYPFPWGLVAVAMVSSAIFGAAAIEVYLGAPGWMGTLILGVAGSAYSMYGLRHEARLWRQRLAREADIAALRHEAGEGSPHAEASPSRPAT